MDAPLASSNGNSGSSADGSDKIHGGGERGRTTGKRKIAETWPEIFEAWPRCTLLLVASMGIQKFTGLETVLTLYLMNGLKYSESQATIYFSLYQVCAGIMPLFGNIWTTRLLVWP